MVRHDVINAMLRGGLAVMLAIELFGCTPKVLVTSEAAQAPLSVDLQLDPTPAHIGTERMTMTVRDRTSAPVTGAEVRISPSFATVPGGHAMRMPRMGRVWKTLRAVDDGDGTYRADIAVAKATHWTFIVDVAAAQTQATIERSVDVR